MFNDVIRVAGNYNVQANNGTITLASPATVITGNLTVYGTQTSVDSVNVVVTSTIMILNQGEPGPGVTRNTPGFPAYNAGFMVSRGNADANTSGAFLLYDDSVTINDGTNSYYGMWRFNGNYYYPGNQYGSVIELQAIRSSNGNTINFLGKENYNGMLNVKGASTVTSYASRVVDPDDIPNKEYVDLALGVGVTSTQQLNVGRSSIRIFDNSVSTTSPYYNVTNQIVAALGNPGNVVFSLSGTQAQFQNITVIGSDFRATSGVNTNISISPTGSGKLVINSGIQLLHTSLVSSSTNHTSIYTTSTIGGGGTGVYFVNNTTSDELVSKKKAIVYGIIF
jgi:hypothetical protein